MSHISRIKTQMVEKELLLMALQDLGFSYEEGDLEVKGFGGQHTHVEIKLPLHLSNDIGFQKSGDAYEIVADWFGVRNLKQKDFTNQLLQRYAYHAACSKLAEQGFTLVNEEKQKDGQIRLVLRRMA